jgi:hypothetical protein
VALTGRSDHVGKPKEARCGGPFVDRYRTRLRELGYAPPSVTHSLVALGHLGRWMDRHHVEVERLSVREVKRFLADHVDRYGRLPSAGVMPMLDYP